MGRNLAIVMAVLVTGSSALAIPGPATTVVVGNLNDEESIALAERYAQARSVPATGVCLLDLPESVDISLADFESRWMAPLMACLGARLPEIEAVLLVRGVPLRVGIPVDGGVNRISAAAAVATWQTTMANGRPIRGIAPGQQGRCGDTPCLAPRFENPYRQGVFEPGWQQFDSGVNWQPVLVTMLHGRNYGDAARLLQSGLDGELAGGVDGTFLLMGGGDAARSILDPELAAVADALALLGVEAEVIDFDSDLVGRTLGAFVTGSARLGRVIEGNTFAPGALVDNVTSYGALPVNFMAEGEQQVSIARWVAQGIAGVHGTTDEPLSHVFPSRQFLVDYAHGMTLAESYHRNLPFGYWRNLVLGDPMTAPFAHRPRVQIGGLEPEQRLRAGVPVTVTAEATGTDEIDALTLYLDGVEYHTVNGPRLETCLRVPEGVVQVLAVAQTGGDYPAKGWTSYTVVGAGMDIDCPPPVDASVSSDLGILDSSVTDAAEVDANVAMRMDAGVSDGIRPDGDLDSRVLANPSKSPSTGCSTPGTDDVSLVWVWILLFGFRRR